MDGVMELSVWADDEPAGRLSRQEDRRHVFNYTTESVDAGEMAETR